MTEHIQRKHKIKSIGSKVKFNELLDNCILSDVERSIMDMYYLEGKDFGYIADILGYSKIGILKMHKRILKRIEALL